MRSEEQVPGEGTTSTVCNSSSGSKHAAPHDLAMRLPSPSRGSISHPRGIRFDFIFFSHDPQSQFISLGVKTQFSSCVVDEIVHNPSLRVFQSTMPASPDTRSPEGYKHSPPYDSGFLPSGSIHRIHYEQYGTPNGKPVVFLHGGPGGGTSIRATEFFDPAVYRVVLHDQRGAGKSEPAAEL